MFDFIPDPVIGGGSGHSQNTDSYLATPVTNLLCVDKKRTDSYVECGSITKPYKTINAALAAITTNSDSNRFVVLISSGTYAEQVTTKAFVYLVSEYPDSVLITQSTGHTVIVPSASGAAAGLRGLNLENLSASNSYNAIHLNDGGSLSMVDCTALSVGGRAAEINNGSFLVAHNVSFQSNDNDGVVCHSGGSLMLDGGTQAGKDGTTWDVSVESGGWMAVTGSLALTNGRLNAAGTVEYRTPGSCIGNDSTVSGSTIKDALETLAVLPQVTKVLHVDKNRTDSYTPDGSVDRPFLTIGAATAIADDGCLLKVVPAIYSEDVTLPAGVSLEGYGANRLVLSGNVTISAGNAVSLRYVTLSGTNKTLTINANCILMDGYASCAVVVNGTATIQAWNFHMVGAASGVTPLTMNSTGKFQSFLATIGSTGDAPAINQTAGQVILNTVLTSASRAGNPVIVSTGGTTALLNSQAINSLGGPAVDLSANGATATNPNMISGLVAVGDVVCGSKVTAVEGLRFVSVGSLSGTAIVHRPASWIDNDSTVSGDTVKDAIETLGKVPDPSGLANNDYVLRVTDGVASWVTHT